MTDFVAISMTRLWMPNVQWCSKCTVQSKDNVLNYKATNEKNKKDEINRISMPVQKGNHLHNLEVVRQKRGYLVVARANKVCCFVPQRCLYYWWLQVRYDHPAVSFKK